jgi:hypothetical protein
MRGSRTSNGNGKMDEMMDELNRPTWESLPQPIRDEWIREAGNFYAHGMVSEADLVDVARENYSADESLHPLGEESQRPA